MAIQELTSEEAISLAVVSSNIDLVTGYPGSPGGGIISKLLQKREYSGDVHWSTNEKIALEKAIGVAISGGTAMVCVKSVGLNAMLDPLSVINLTPFNGGSLIIIVGDDPGGYGSQNDQDSRLLANFLDLPWFEPTGVQSSYNHIYLAIQLSQKFGMPVFIRITRYTSNLKETISVDKPELPTFNLKKENISTPRFVPAPANAVAKSLEHINKIDQFKDCLEIIGLNEIFFNERAVGIIACGAVGHKMRDLIMHSDITDLADILIMETVYPLPEKQLYEFMENKNSVIVMEENKPFLLSKCKIIAADSGLLLDWEQLAKPGELSKKDIAGFLNSYFSMVVIDEAAITEDGIKLKSNCATSRYDEVLDILDANAKIEGLDVKYYGDPGCLVSVYERLEAKYAIGGSVVTVLGANLLNKDSNRINIAFIGDSGLFHSSLLAIIDAAWHKRSVAMVLLNNNTALTTGKQDHAGSNDKINYKSLFESCGISNYQKINIDSPVDKINSSIRSFLLNQEIRILEIVIDDTSITS